MEESMFTLDDGAFVPTVYARGPWSLESLHGGLATGWEEIISRTLETSARVSIVGVSQTDFDAYIQSLPSPSVTLHYLMGPTSGRVIFDLSPELATAVKIKLTGSGTSDWDWAGGGKPMTTEDWERMFDFPVFTPISGEGFWCGSGC